MTWSGNACETAEFHAANFLSCTVVKIRIPASDIGAANQEKIIQKLKECHVLSERDAAIRAMATVLLFFGVASWQCYDYLLAKNPHSCERMVFDAIAFLYLNYIMYLHTSAMERTVREEAIRVDSKEKFVLWVESADNTITGEVHKLRNTWRTSLSCSR